MTLNASLKFAKSLIFPKSEKKSSARKSLFGALVCIGISIVPLVCVIAITDGMINGMTERLIGLSTSHLQAYIASSAPLVHNGDAFLTFAEEVESIQGVKAAYPEIRITGLAAGKNIRSGAEIRAVQNDIFQKNESFNKLFNVIEGSIDGFLAGTKDKKRPAVIGQKLAETLEIHPGDNFKIITTRNIGGRISPKLTTFTVSAIISSGYQELDALWVFIPLQAAYDSLALANASYTMMIESYDAFSPKLVGLQKEVKSCFGRFANIYRWDQLHASEFENFSSTRVMLVFIMTLIVLVASINISSAIVMLVMERRKEIAILKSIGATPSGITLSFLLAGLSCGIGGVILGLPVGLLCAVNSNQIVSMLEKAVNFIVLLYNSAKGIPASQVSAVHLMDPAYYLSEIPVSIPFYQLLFIIAGTLILSLLVSVIPAIKAGREKPLDILRKL